MRDENFPEELADYISNDYHQEPTLSSNGKTYLNYGPAKYVVVITIAIAVTNSPLSTMEVVI